MAAGIPRQLEHGADVLVERGFIVKRNRIGSSLFKVGEILREEIENKLGPDWRRRQFFISRILFEPADPKHYRVQYRVLAEPQVR